jgi:hypothetical protein
MSTPVRQDIPAFATMGDQKSARVNHSCCDHGSGEASENEAHLDLNQGTMKQPEVRPARLDLDFIEAQF